MNEHVPLFWIQEKQQDDLGLKSKSSFIKTPFQVSKCKTNKPRTAQVGAARTGQHM